VHERQGGGEKEAERRRQKGGGGGGKAAERRRQQHVCGLATRSRLWVGFFGRPDAWAQTTPFRKTSTWPGHKQIIEGQERVRRMLSHCCEQHNLAREGVQPLGDDDGVRRHKWLGRFAEFRAVLQEMLKKASCYGTRLAMTAKDKEPPVRG